MKIGVCVGRWQIPSLHSGHINTLNWVFERSDLMVLMVGVSRTRGSKQDPLDFHTRYLMLRQMYPQALIWAIGDEASDVVWSEKLDQMLSQFAGEVILYGSRDSFIPRYHGKLKTEEVPTNCPGISGTESRKGVNKPAQDANFRKGVIYAANMKWPQAFPTVDMVVVNANSQGIRRVLLGKKRGDAGWRFPGGFVDPSDSNLESAAARELQEETGIDVFPDNFRYLGSLQVQDWRYRGEERIITSIFGLFTTEELAIKAADDLIEVSWWDGKLIDAGPTDFLVSTHIPIYFRVRKFILGIS